jgi:hypothetical protein
MIRCITKPKQRLKRSANCDWNGQKDDAMTKILRETDDERRGREILGDDKIDGKSTVFGDANKGWGLDFLSSPTFTTGSSL